jgi:hypothetical protein
MTGRGEGYCVLELTEPGRLARGYAGLQGMPVHLEAPADQSGRWPHTAGWQRPAFGRGRGRAARRGRGRRLRRW